MKEKLSKDLSFVLREAEDIAKNLSQELNSCYILLGLFTVPNEAEAFLIEQGIDEDTLLATMRKLTGEGREVVERILEQAVHSAESTGYSTADCRHLLLTICRERETLAYMMLINADANMTQLRTRLMSALTSRVNGKATAEPSVVNMRTSVAESKSSVSGEQSRPEISPKESLKAKPVEHPLPKYKPFLRENNAKKTADKPVELFKDKNPYAIDEAEYPWLSKLGKNLTQLAADGRFDPLIGRGREIEEVIDILGKRRANNPILVGEPGVGKTAIVEGLADIALKTPKLVPALKEKIIVEIDLHRLTAGTTLRGSLAERLNGIRDEVLKSSGKFVVFIDEIHAINSLGGGDSPEEATNALKSALARGEFPCIGATTNDEFKKFINADPAFERRFVPVLIPEPSVEDTVSILNGIKSEYESHHGINFTPDAISAAAILSSRYISERFLPDKAISLLDLSGSRARRVGKEFVTEEEIARVVSRIASIPEEKLLLKDTERLLNMEAELAKRIIGHDSVIKTLSDVIRRNYAGFRAKRPIGSFLFLGPTGVGKTQLVKELADFLFNSKDALVRIDMSEYGEAHSTSRLIGAPPGYVGYEAGGQLTEAVRRKPFQIILLDEIEKAHRDVLQILLQILDEGRLTDGRGRTVDFTNTVVVLTSNLGSDVFSAESNKKVAIGFAAPTSDKEEEKQGQEENYEKTAAQVLTKAKRFFSPELWNRIEERLVFAPLQRKQLEEITKLELEKSAVSLQAERNISFKVRKAVVEWVLENGGYQPALGARPLRQTIQRLIEAKIAEGILKGEIKNGEKLVLDVQHNELVIKREK